MDNLFAILILLSLICLPISLIKPSLFRFLQKGKPTRLKASLTFLGILISSFILFGVTYHAPSTKNAEPTVVAKVTSVPSKQTQPTAVPKKTASAPKTPTPTDDPCKDEVGTEYYASCIKAATPKMNVSVQATYSYLQVTNNEDVSLTSCDYSIGSDFSNSNFYELGVFSDYATIPAHQTISVPWGSLTKPDGTRFNYYNQAPTDLVIDCTGAKGDEEWSNY